MKDRDIARVYAKSMMALCKNESIDLVGELEKVVNVLNSSNELEALLFLDAFREEEKLDVLKVICEKISLNKVIVNFLSFLVMEKRIGLFNIIYKEVVVADDEEKGFIRGTIEGQEDSINEETSNKLKTFLRNKLGKEPNLEYKKSEKITAGYRVKVEDYLLDASFDNQLENFKKTIMF